MNFHQVLQKEEIINKFDKEILFEQYDVSDIDVLKDISPNILFEIGAHAWMHYVVSGIDVNPLELSNNFEANNPLIYRKIENVMKEKIIQDLSFSYAKLNDESLEKNICCQLLLCRMHPNDLFIADVEFSNPYQPVPNSEQRYQFHEYRSLGLFKKHLENMKEYCNENQIERITLTTASNDQIPYFEEHGFLVEDNDFARQSREIGHSVPMYLKCI